MVYIDTTFGNKLFDVAITELISKIPPKSGKNDIFREMTTGKFHLEI